MDYFSQYISAILISSTALMGLTGVFFAQIRFSSQTRTRALKPEKLRELRIRLSWSMLLGIFVILFLVLGFFTGSEFLLAVAGPTFILQLIVFIFAAMSLDLFIFY